MNSHPEKKRATESGAGRSEKRGWREDSLSVFLIVAALLLGAMYLYDQWRASVLDEQATRAAWIQQRFGIDGANCQVNSTGLGGEILVFDCGGIAAPKLASAASAMNELSGELGHFKQVVFVGTEVQLHCPTKRAGWPDKCHAEPLPDVAE